MSKACYQTSNLTTKRAYLSEAYLIIAFSIVKSCSNKHLI